MEILDKIDKVEPNKFKEAFKNLLTVYLTPAFGSISKRDFDICLFMELQNLGLIEKDPEIYELVSELRVTRAKARNLLYEAKLRSLSEDDLDKELKQLLLNPIFIKLDKMIGLEVSNLYLIDHLKFKLKKLRYISDGSFSPEIVKLTTDAYIALFKSSLPEEQEKKIIDALIKIEAIEDKSINGIFKAILGKLGKKLADETGGDIAKSAVDYLNILFDENKNKITEKISSLFSNVT